MAELWLYVIAAFSCLACLAVALRQRGVASAEGICFAFSAALIFSDVAGLLISAHAGMSDGLISAESEMRIVPTIYFSIGVLAFLIGLIVSDPHAKTVRRLLKESEKIYLNRLGWVLAAEGCLLYVIGVFLINARFDANYYQAMNAFRTEQNTFGGFWYRGIDLALIGICIVAATTTSSRIKRSALIIGFVVQLGLATGKNGAFKAIVCAALILYAYDHKTFRRLSTVPAVILLAVIFLLGTGYKANIRTGMTLSEMGGQDAISGSLASIERRYSNEGLYRGYCQMITLLRHGDEEYFGGDVARYTLLSWIPRIVFPDKPDNVFRKIGYLVNIDRRNLPRQVSAPLLAGYAYLDSGFVTTIIYLSVGGICFGTVRRRSLAWNSRLYWHVWYLTFVLLGGISAENGFANSLYHAVLAAVSIAAAEIVARDILLPNRQSRSIFNHCHYDLQPMRLARPK